MKQTRYGLVRATGPLGLIRLLRGCATLARHRWSCGLERGHLSPASLARPAFDDVVPAFYSGHPRFVQVEKRLGAALVTLRRVRQQLLNKPLVERRVDRLSRC